MSTASTPADCFDPRLGLMPLAEARRRVLESVTPVAEVEMLALDVALDRVLAGELVSPMDVPPHTNAAMDGFAVAGGSLPSQGTRSYRLVGTALAGAPYRGAVGEGETVRVMTGAVMPAGTDTVVIQENVEQSDRAVVVPAAVRPGENVRDAGEDIRAGSTVLGAGTVLGPAELGVIASLGLAQVGVRRRVRVGVFSTGDELRAPGEPLERGMIYDSNRQVIKAMLRRLGAGVEDMGVIRDRREDVMSALERARAGVDVIITSGGVSTGTADYVTDALRRLGEIDVWRIAIRPGRPFAHGLLGDTLFFGLPGNPVAVMVTFYQLVQPALRRLMGQANIDPVPLVQARTLSRLRKRPHRTEVYRGILERDASGAVTVRSTGSQGSGVLSSMSAANCFVILPDDAASVEVGAVVDVQPFDGIV